ncbi:MAG: HAD family hydrolase [Lachnospiraceae bacterium]|nr:HAD family hydrolase [Lachnospiraceae bacterium]
MIKLIASDLDGTLLYGRNNTVSDEMFEMIREMKKRGIIFAAASGRQYHNLKKLFAPVWQDMAFICENGAAVFYKDRIIAEQIVPMEELLEIVYMVEADERTEVALSSSTTTYVRPKTREYVDLLVNIGNNVTEVKEWTDVTEPCVKVAWYEKAGVEDRVDYWSKKIKPPAKVVTSGAEWLDILYPNTHKGVGMQVLLEHFHLKKEEVVAFGDNINDAEMLEAVGYPIAMRSGKDAIKEMCQYHTDRVEDTVRMILDGNFLEK